MKESKRPVIELEKDSIDWVFEGLAFLAILCLVAVPLYFYQSLPEIIPTHFNAVGEADGFGKRSNIWILPVMGLLIYTGMSFLTKIPHKFNYAKKVTPENARTQYQAVVRMMRYLNATVSIALAYIVYMTVLTAMGRANGLGWPFVAIFLLFTMGGIWYFIIKSGMTKV